jgi:CheY-like chemotaxis protein
MCVCCQFTNDLGRSSQHCWMPLSVGYIKAGMKKSHITPFAIRLIGYLGDERTELNRQFVQHHKQGGTAFHAMHEDDLLDPDVYVVKMDAPGSRESLERLRPGPARPALLVSIQPIESPHRVLQAPLDKNQLLEALEQLIVLRAEALARLPAAEVVHVPERRRQLPPRPMPEALRSRRQALVGGVLVVDRDPDFAHGLASLVAARRLRVDRANEHRTAVILCKQFPVSLVIINTATPGLDPYKLCSTVKEQSAGGVRVIFLVGRYFSYLPDLARASGCDGFINKPLSNRQLDSLLHRFLPTDPDDVAELQTLVGETTTGMPLQAGEASGPTAI